MLVGFGLNLAILPINKFLKILKIKDLDIFVISPSPLFLIPLSLDLADQPQELTFLQQVDYQHQVHVEEGPVVTG